MKTVLAPALALGAAALILSGCEGARADTPASQVVATVDGTEITATQLRDLIETSRGAATPNIERAALDRLVGETLLEKRALDMDLDQSPQIARRIDAARRAILAQAYLERATGSAPAPDDAAIREFYAAHPWLFRERKRYQLTSVELRASPERVKPLKAAFAAPGASLATLLDQLNGLDSVAVPMARTLDGDQLPDMLAREFGAMKPGDNVTWTVGDTHHFATLDGIAPSPVPLSQARERIARHLAAQRTAAAAEAEVKRLRGAAEIVPGPLGERIKAGSGSKVADAR
jgi:EpsD family peptidyl-prolyl cis-trans isomerase